MLAALPGRPRRDKVSRFRADLITEGAYFVSGNWGANRGDSPSGKERELAKAIQQKIQVWESK